MAEYSTSRALAPFGKLPTAAIEKGLARDLKPRELRVFVAICGLCTTGDGIIEVSRERLSDLTGVHMSTIPEVTRALADRGVIRVDRGVGRGNLNRYAITKGRDTPTVSGGGNGRETPTFQGEKGSAHDPEKVGARGENGRRTPTPSKEVREEDIESAAREALKRAGVPVGKLPELMAEAGVSPEQAEPVIAACFELGQVRPAAPIGVKIAAIRSYLDEAAQQVRRRSAMQSRRELARRWWSKLSDAERAEAVEAVYAWRPNLKAAGRGVDDPSMPAWAYQVVKGEQHERADVSAA